MPFMGKDWRAPGDAWVRIVGTSQGWERIKLRPIQQMRSDSEASIETPPFKLDRPESGVSLSSNDENEMNSSDDSVSDSEDWIPHCFVKTSKSKEFVGCTSMSEAFHRLDLARAVADVRRFNYICKVVQILVRDKLANLSASARKNLLSIIEAIVLNSVETDSHVSTARDLVERFGTGLDTNHLYGSPKIASLQMNTVGDLLELLADRFRPVPVLDSDEHQLTFIDLPREIISTVLRRLPDHISLLEAAKAHETLEALVETEARLWASLCHFHFSPEQITKHYQNQDWRHTFYQLKKYYGLREIYADLIHICCHCKALFWKGLGHPCVSQDAPSVRVTPAQFVDMLLFL